MDFTQVLSLWLHTLAFVIVMGYYGVLGRIVLPGLRRSLDLEQAAGALMAIERRALPFVLLSVVLFALTGSYLLVIDPDYAGLGNYTTSWATLMLFKHVVVVTLVVVGLMIDRMIRQLADAADDTAREQALRRIGLSAEGATGLGALTILLTVMAQLSV